MTEFITFTRNWDSYISFLVIIIFVSNPKYHSHRYTGSFFSFPILACTKMYLSLPHATATTKQQK